MKMKKGLLEVKDPVIAEYILRVRKKLGRRLLQMYLFGSRARGDFWKGSDYDFAVVVEYRNHELEEAILDVSTFLLDHYDVLVSTQIFTLSEWEFENKLPLGLNIRKEGIVL